MRVSFKLIGESAVGAFGSAATIENMNVVQKACEVHGRILIFGKNVSQILIIEPAIWNILRSIWLT